MNKLIYFVLAASLILSACTAGGSADLDGTSWTLTELNGQPVLPDRPASLQFEKDRLGGSDSCNSFGGSYTASGSQIKVGNDMVSTLMACEEAVMQQASAYTSALLQAVEYKIEGGQLTLLDADGKTLAAFAPLVDDTTNLPD